MQDYNQSRLGHFHSPALEAGYNDVFTLSSHWLLVMIFLCSDWPLTLLWVWFYDSRSKSALIKTTLHDRRKILDISYLLISGDYIFENCFIPRYNHPARGDYSTEALIFKIAVARFLDIFRLRLGIIRQYSLRLRRIIVKYG